MVKIPEDIIQGLKQLAKAKDIQEKVLVERMREIRDNDENIKAIGDSEKEEEFKIRYSWAILYEEYSSAGKTVDVLLRPLATPQPREVKTKNGMTWVGDLSAIIQVLEKGEDEKLVKGEPKYATGTFWRDGAKNLLKLERDKVYRASLIVGEGKTGWGSTITSDRATFSLVEDKVIGAEELYKREKSFFDKKMIHLGDMDLNKSEDVTDIRVIEATVTDSNVGERDGREYGYYNIMDSTIMGSTVRLFVSPKDVIWLKGSIIKFVGNVDIDRDDNARFNLHFMVPTDDFRIGEFSIKPVVEEKEVVDVSEEAGAKTETEEKDKTNFEF